MSKSVSVPIVATSNGWTPIDFFDPTSDYAEQRFLVWIVDGRGNQWFETARVMRGRLVGKWRYLRNPDGTRNSPINALEPLAFKLVPGPDLDDLQRLREKCATHFLPSGEGASVQKRKENGLYPAAKFMILERQ